MRLLIAIAIGCALILGIHHTSRSVAAPTLPAVEEQSCASEADDDGDSYICLYSPRCSRASQCVDYCAGGAPVCFQGCCSCAS